MDRSRRKSLCACGPHLQSGDRPSHGANSQEIMELLESVDFRNQVKVIRLTALGRYIAVDRGLRLSVLLTYISLSLTLLCTLQVLSPHDLDRSAIVVCHSFPDLWLRPDDTYPQVSGTPCPTKDMMDK